MPETSIFLSIKIDRHAEGMLPILRSFTISQSIVFLAWWIKIPVDLVIDAYNKSVPTAIAGGMENPSTRIGVINEPPPTPVTPTTKPTKNPMSVYAMSI